MKWRVERGVTLLAASTLIACLALPASLSFARHRQLAGGARRSMCEPFSPRAPSRAARAGDTLWSLTEEMTGKPWVWPRVWALNPEMGNPHQLAVGQVVHFVDRGGPAVALASHVPAMEPSPPVTAEPSDGASTEAGPDLVDDLADDLGGLSSAEAGLGQPAASPKAAAAGSRTPSAAARLRLLPDEAPTRAPARAQAASTLLPAGLFARDEWRAFGTVVDSTQQALLGGVGERLRIDWPGAPLPGPWALLRTPEGRQTQEDGHATGRMATVTGRASALPAGSGWQARVDANREGIELGQRVAPIDWFLATPAVPHAAARPICGRIVAHEHASIAGSPSHVLFFDRGSRHGLEAGHVLLGEGEGIGRLERPLLRVLRAGPNTATLLSLRSEQEFTPGQTLCSASAEQLADAAIARWMR